MRPDKPEKPYPDFPLTASPNGVWVKKIKGKQHTFGGWRDPDGALAEYLRQKDYLQAGKVPPPKNAPPAPVETRLTLEELANQFLEARHGRVEMGRITKRMHSDYVRSCRKVVAIMGRNTIVETLKPSDFDKLAFALSKGVSQVTFANRFRLARAMFLFASKQELIPKRLNFGENFALPDKSTLRAERQAIGSKEFTADELRAILDAAGVPLKAMVLLGINCAFGNNDCATLPRSAVDLDGGWIDFPRRKTGVERRCPLWKETITALREALAKRPLPKSSDDTGLVFITRQGSPYVRFSEKGTNLDALAGEFAKVLKLLKLNGRRRAFYSLRRTFETVGGASLDQVSVSHVMGHSPASDDMSAVYRQSITDDRLLAVTNYVRTWLWPPKKRTVKKTPRQKSKVI